MRYFYYVHTGHRIGLDRFWRSVALINALEEIEITLLCSDYRIASVARDYGIKRAVGIDVVRNIPQIASHGDVLIFDSSEFNPTLLEDMSLFFSTLIRISDDPHDVLHPREWRLSLYHSDERTQQGYFIDPIYDTASDAPKTIPIALFFGDDDYEQDLLRYHHLFAPYAVELLWGFYFFLGDEHHYRESFKVIHESESYTDVIAHSDLLITCSPQALLQHHAAGGRCIYWQREDYPTDYHLLFEHLGIVMIEHMDEHSLAQAIDQARTQDVPKRDNLNTQVVNFLKKVLNLV